jgi:hypothetical protein
LHISCEQQEQDNKITTEKKKQKKKRKSKKKRKNMNQPVSMSLCGVCCFTTPTVLNSVTIISD